MSSPPAVRPPCASALARPSSYWAGTSFSRDQLPTRPGPLGAGQPEPSSSSGSILKYLSAELLLPPGDYLETCRDAWAFSVSAMVQCALVLQYARLGARFANRSMSSNFLLSCFDVGPAEMCGCLGSDLPAVFRELSREGLVTFNQFPYYTSEDLGSKLYADIDVEYFCRNREQNGSCRRCASAAEYHEVVLSASRDQGSFRFLVPCMPCSNPQVPRYYPEGPFVVGGATDEARAAAIRAELARLGPLCSTLVLDEEAFSSLFSGGAAPVVQGVEQGLFYRPRRAQASARLLAVLLVGYADEALGGGGGPFWICQNQNGSSNFGYSLRDGGSLIKGLFNVAAMDGASRLLEQTISFDRMLIKTDVGAGKKELSAADPFVELPGGKAPGPPRLGAEARDASPGRKKEPSSGSRWRPWLAWALLAAASFLLLLSLALFATSSPEER
jgi:Papain family cysteine protease